MILASAAASKLLRVVPSTLHAHVLAHTVNHLLRGQLLAGRLGELHGKRFRLGISDAGIDLTFEITGTGLAASTLDPDVTIRGSLRDFVALARRREDPDALFFQRRIVVEGETESGLHLKNLLDSWEYDWPAHARAVLPAPLVRLILAVADALRSLHASARLRRPGSHRTSRPEAPAAEP